MAKSNLTKAKEISFATKQKVLDRQGNRSITGVYLAPYNIEFHHVVSRSASGVGYEWNIVALTKEEHRLYHDHCSIPVNGKERYTWMEFGILMKNHLKMRYEGWSEQNCKVRKYAKESDYGVTRKELWK